MTRQEIELKAKEIASKYYLREIIENKIEQNKIIFDGLDSEIIDLIRKCFENHIVHDIVYCGRSFDLNYNNDPYIYNEFKDCFNNTVTILSKEFCNMKTSDIFLMGFEIDTSTPEEMEFGTERKTVVEVQYE